jgi:hypothetical protein
MDAIMPNRVARMLSMIKEPHFEQKLESETWNITWREVGGDAQR